jgi:hypothetical protein
VLDHCLIDTRSDRNFCGDFGASRCRVQLNLQLSALLF